MVIDLEPAALDRVNQFAGANQNAQLAFVVAGTVRAAPSVQVRNFTDSIDVSGSFSGTVAPSIAAGISGGYRAASEPEPTKGTLPSDEARPKPDFVASVDENLHRIGWIPGDLLSPPPDSNGMPARPRFGSDSPYPVYADDLITAIGDSYPGPLGYTPVGHAPRNTLAPTAP